MTISHPTRSFVTFLTLAGHLRPGYDYLIHRKLAMFWRHLPTGPLTEDLTRFLGAAQELGFTERTRSASASQVIGRLLIQTGPRLHALTGNDFDDLLAASAARHGAGKASRHYGSATHTARQVIFHLGVFTEQPVNATSLLRQSFAQRMRDASPALQGSFVAYLDRLTATHTRGTVTGTATRLNHFAAHLAAVDPALPSLAELDRRRHIETYLTGDRRGDQLAHRGTDPGLGTPRPSPGGALPAQRHRRMGLAGSTPAAARVSLRYPQAAPPLGPVTSPRIWISG